MTQLLKESGLTRWCSGKESKCQCRRCKRCRFNPWVRMIPWSGKWQLTPVFLPEESHGQRSLAGCSPWGHKESNVTEYAHSNNSNWKSQDFKLPSMLFLLPKIPFPFYFCYTSVYFKNTSVHFYYIFFNEKLQKEMSPSCLSPQLRNLLFSDVLCFYK